MRGVYVCEGISGERFRVQLPYRRFASTMRARACYAYDPFPQQKASFANKYLAFGSNVFFNNSSIFSCVFFFIYFVRRCRDRRTSSVRTAGGFCLFVVVVCTLLCIIMLHNTINYSLASRRCREYLLSLIIIFSIYRADSNPSIGI